MALTPSEALVEQLAKASFLSLWSYPNPLAEPGKELCDMLVVCEPDVIIFSVKEIGLTDPGDDAAVARWRRKAIDASARQLYGARRNLDRLENVIRADGSLGLPLPKGERRVHLVAVALGSGGNVPFDQGDLGKGFVHVLDDMSLRVVMEELDTITDFVEYLRAKERFIAAGARPIVTGGEQDLLAVYLHRGRSFPVDLPQVVIEEGAWNELTHKPEWSRRKAADRESYVWDKLIEGVARDVLGPGLEFGTAEGAEQSMRVMAREDRFARRVIASAFNALMIGPEAKTVRSRTVQSPSGVQYVFLATEPGEPREFRGNELRLRCYAVRSMMPAYAPVVGLARDRYVPGAGYSLDVFFCDIPIWTEELEEKAAAMRADLGYFATPRLSRSSHDEYPQPPSRPAWLVLLRTFLIITASFAFGVGVIRAGMLGAMTTCVTIGLMFVAPTERPRRVSSKGPGSRVGAMAQLILVPLAALAGGWRWGWLTAIGGSLAALLVTRTVWFVRTTLSRRA